MKRNAIIGTVVIAVIGIMLYAVTTRGSGVVASGGTQTAPDFALKDLQGNTVRLSDLRGKAVVLNFWATWCPPCQEEIPWFIDLQKQYGSQGLQIVGVSMDDGGAGVVAPFVRQMGMNYTVLMGDSQVGDEYGGIHALPTTFYIGRDGKVLEIVPGLIPHYEVEQNIKAALATAAAPAAQNQTANSSDTGVRSTVGQ